MTRIMLVDDHAIFRVGLRVVIDAEDDCEVVAEASSGEGALAKLDEARPDIVVLDISLAGGMNGLQVAREILSTRPAISVIVLSMHEEIDRVREALSLGVSAYVLKGSDVDDVVEAIRKVGKGQRYLSPALAEQAFDLLTNPDGPKTPRVPGLTERESQVIILVAEGATSAQIGERLFISTRTVETHRANAMRKLCLRNQADVVRWALKRGLIGDED
ncbi:MAG: response regulator transcription factor [Armatimonadetes bacterium]|nr:response regulator transcription factor [Armatimonadota bacterium]